MPMRTYRLEIAETEASTGIDVDCYDEDGTITETARVDYEDFGIEPDDRTDRPPRVVREVTADVTTLDLQFERDGEGFSFRLLGDRDELVSERVTDEEWELAAG